MICWMITCDEDSDPVEVDINIHEALRASKDLDYCKEWQLWKLITRLDRCGEE